MSTLSDYWYQFFGGPDRQLSFFQNLLPGSPISVGTDGKIAAIEDYPGVIVPPAAMSVVSGSPAAHQIANRVFGLRFHLPRATTLRYVNFNIGTSSGNIQVGTAKLSGVDWLDFERVMDSGVIAAPVAGPQRIDCGATLHEPGDYVLFFWADNTVITVPAIDLGTSMAALRAALRINSIVGGLPASGTFDAWGGWCNLMSIEGDPPA